MSALERLAVPVRFTLFRVDVQAFMARLGRVGWRNQDHLYASNRSFVFDKLPQLVERPVVGSAPFSFATRFLVQALSNTCQVLQSKGSLGSLGILHQGFADVVIQPRLVAPFSPREPAKQSATASAAFGLNTGTHSTVSVTGGWDVVATPRPSVTGGGNIPSAQVNSNHLRGFACGGSIQLNRNVDGVISLLGLGQCRTGGGLPPQQRYLVATDLELEPNPSTHQRHPNRLFGLLVLKSTSIQTQASWAKLMDLFNRLGVADNPANRLTNVISFQSSCLSDCLVGQVMQLDGIPAFFTFGGIQYLMASVSESLQGAVNVLTQLYRDY